MRSSSVLLCFERSPKECHRTMVAAEMEQVAGFEVRNLGVYTQSRIEKNPQAELVSLRNFLSAAKLLLLLQQVGTEGGGKVAGSRRERILILCKTYPSPSGNHYNTYCGAGMKEVGR